MIYIDKPQLRLLKGQQRLTAHLISDASVAELHNFVADMGGSTRGFHDKPGKPHYDMVEGNIDRALAAGAKQVSSREIVLLLRKLAG